MKKFGIAISTILLASAAAVVTLLPAGAAFHGGGGGGHGGGGGFHGGGGGFHGGGGGFHGGGGGFHGIGGGFHGFGGHGFGGLRGLGGRSFGGFHGLGGRSFGGFHGIGRHGIGGHNIASHGIAGQGHGERGAGQFGGRGFSTRSGRFATRTAPGFSQRAFARGFAHNGFHQFHRYGVFGWAGPVFWPYAYNDISCGVFWGYWGSGCADPFWNTAYGDPFWDYGYGDIYGGLFSPFAFADVARYLPGGASGARQNHSKDGSAAPAGAIAQMCGDDTKDVTGWPIDRIQQAVSPTDQQRMALDDLANASVKAAQIIKNGCPTSVAITPPGRLAAMQQRIEAMQQAVETVRGPLEAFYRSLTDEQKAKFNVANDQSADRRNGRHPAPAQSCSAASSATEWPEARIESVLQPNEAQKEKLKTLQNAAAQAAEQLAASCPSELPATPPSRVEAIAERLDVMLRAVKTVRVAIDDLYRDLSDEQKAQFNQIGVAHTAAQ